MYYCFIPAALTTLRKLSAPKIRSLSDLNFSLGCGRRLIIASSRAAAATLAFPDLETRQPTIMRSQQSMTAVMWHQPSLLVMKWLISTAHRTSGYDVLLAQPSTRGRRPLGLFFMSKPLIFRVLRSALMSTRTFRSLFNCQ